MKRAKMAIPLVAALVMLAGGYPARAGTLAGTASLDSSALVGPFELVFVLTDGSGTGDANNTVTLSNFLFGGGSAGSVDASLSFGGESGDLSSGVALVDSFFVNIFASSFTPGSALSFDFSLTTNVDAGGTPDQFSFELLHSDGTSVNTTDPSGANSLLTVNLDSAHPGISTFASELTPAPIVVEAGVAPEPSSLALFAIALAGALWPVRRHEAMSVRA
jgi:hypothetical protein